MTERKASCNLFLDELDLLAANLRNCTQLCLLRSSLHQSLNSLLSSLLIPVRFLMSAPSTMPPGRSVPEFASTPSSSVWDRMTTWASENKAVVYTIAGIAVVVTGAGVAYYFTDSVCRMNIYLGVKCSLIADGHPQKVTTIGRDSPRKSSKKEKKGKTKKKEEDQKSDVEKGLAEPKPKPPTVEIAEELPDVDETTVGNLSEQERKDYAAKLKAAGNTAYGSKDYNRAIELYGKAILCKPDPIFYSNRAACYNALGQWEKVIEDTTAAITLDNEYVKALNRRANAYEHMEKYSEALLDFTASCIIDGFRNESSAQAVERLLKKVAEAKGKAILAEKDKRLPSPTFVTNYLQSFRARPPPAGLEESLELPEDTGKGQLQLGLRSMAKKTGDGYEEAASAFDKALDLGVLEDLESFAYNMRGTFRYLRGENHEALSDLTKSVDLNPALTQSFIKRASMHLELGTFPLLDCLNPDLQFSRKQRRCC